MMQQHKIWREAGNQPGSLLDQESKEHTGKEKS